MVAQRAHIGGSPPRVARSRVARLRASAPPRLRASARGGKMGLERSMSHFPRETNVYPPQRATRGRFRRRATRAIPEQFRPAACGVPLRGERAHIGAMSQNAFIAARATGSEFVKNSAIYLWECAIVNRNETRTGWQAARGGVAVEIGGDNALASSRATAAPCARSPQRTPERTA